MKGKVCSREKYCPVCGQRFQVVEEADILCFKCQTRPKTYFIFLYWQGEKFRISRDIDGHILDSHRRAHRLLETMRKEIDMGIFNPSHYIKKEIEQFRGWRLLKRWVRGKEAQGLAPTHLQSVRHYAKLYEVYFGKMDMRQVRRQHIDEFLEGLSEELS